MNEEVRIIRELHRQGHTHGVAAPVYTKKHSLDPAELIPPMKARIDPAGSRWVEEICRLMQDPDSFPAGGR